MRIRAGKKNKLKIAPKKKTKREEPQTGEVKYENLADAMNYNRDFAIFYSGVESDTYFQGCYDMGVRNFLMSYHYLQGMKMPMHKKYGGLGIKFIIDSGAFTYMQDPKFVEYDREHWENHIKRYLAWAEKNREYIFAIANLDLDYLVGGKQVQEWNAKYFEPFMLRTGIIVCFVWHEDSAQDWEWYCERYPYVGFSSVNDGEGKTGTDLAYFKDKLRIAEKHNTLVHGFGMTRTGMLPQLPFYTVDSTTWKSGFMYGKLLYWNDKKVVSVAKESFPKAFQYIRKYDLDPPIDEDKIVEYYEPEVLRANVYAYQRAEESICNQLKPLTYWKKEKANKRTEAEVMALPFPNIEWMRGETKYDGWQEKAKLFNINPADKKFAVSAVINATVLLHWDDFKDEDFAKANYTPEVISSLHDRCVNKIRDNVEQKIEDLAKYYMDNLTGEIDTLLQHGTNFDRTVKERDEYITDDEYETVDVPQMEVENLVARFLPKKDSDDDSISAMDAISKLDDEIFEENGITPVRDSHGRFLKGQRQVLKPKRLYSNLYPQYSCTTCVNAQKCPEYKEGYVCAYNKMFDRYDTRNENDVMSAMQGIADLAMVRLQRAMITETMNGGIPDPAVSQLMNQAMGLNAKLDSMYRTRNQEVIRQTQVVRSDGTKETMTQVSTNPQSGGILEKLFGDMGKEEPEEKVVDAEVVE